MSTAMRVVNRPIGFDRVHPESPIMTIREKIPTKKEILPMTRGSSNSSAVTVRGYPFVVFMSISVMEKITAINALQAIMAARMSRSIIRPLSRETKILATAAIENPPSRELMRTNWLAS